jgi:hypothetical protein
LEKWPVQACGASDQVWLWGYRKWYQRSLVRLLCSLCSRLADTVSLSVPFLVVIRAPLAFPPCGSIALRTKVTNLDQTRKEIQMLRREQLATTLMLIVFILMALVFVVWVSQGDLVQAAAAPVMTPAPLYLPLINGETAGEAPTATPTATATATGEPTATPTTTPTEPSQSPQSRGLFALTDWLTYNAATAVDGDGGVHLAFYTSDERHDADPRGQPAYYAYCPGPVADCADPANWSDLVQMDDGVIELQIAVTKAGQPRLLVRRNGNRGYDHDFWACDQNCTDAQNWAGLRVNEAMSGDLFPVEMPQHSFALDSQDRPRFVYGNGWGNGRPTAIYYTWCDAADCTELGSWEETPIYGPVEGRTVSSDYASLAFDGDQPRVVTRLQLSGLPVSVDYYECNAGCDDPFNWSSHTLALPGNQMWVSWDLALDSNGHPHIALFEPASIDITVGGRLFYAWCEADDCTGEGKWNLTEVATGEGKSVDLAIDPQGRMHMVYDAGQRGALGHLWCDSDCTTGSQWQRRILETSDQLQAEFPVAIPFTCNQETEHAWLDALPTVDFGPDGELVVAYDVKHVATCYYRDPGNPDPIITRVERIWWAVRWAFFEQP